MILNTVKCNHLMPLHFKGFKTAILSNKARKLLGFDLTYMSNAAF